jgi:hypothetical protein
MSYGPIGWMTLGFNLLGSILIIGIFVGVGLFICRIPGLMGNTTMGPFPGTVVGDGSAGSAATSVGTSVAATTGSGGATIEASVLGIQLGVVTEPATHAKPPTPAGNSIYHHVPSVLLPATLAEPPCGIVPIILYACPGPLRTFATTEVVTVGLHASAAGGVGVSEKAGVTVGVGVAVFSFDGSWVEGAPPGRLHPSKDRARIKVSNIFLFIADIISPPRD